ncbi:MAG: hypothetical protein ACE5FA_07640, partial [Dehalococcoidia bacterium]
VSASVDEITLPASTDSTWSTTGVGFKPDTVLFASSNRTVTGGAAGGSLSLGAMDNQGNQWAIYIESLDAQSTSNAKTRQITDGCLMTTDGALDAEASYVSMDDDGFTLNYSNAGTQALVSALSIKGLQIKAGTVDKRTSTGNQAVEDPGFTSEAFMVVGGNATTLDALTDGAALAIGAASSTSAVETAAIFDEDAQGTTDTERISDTTAAMILQTTDADGGIDNEATCGNIDMGTAGWLNWGTADANANKLHYLAFAGLAGSNTKMIHYHNGQGLTKISVSSNVPTEEESHDWGAAAVAGPPVKFEDNWYCPLGTEANAQKITAIGDSGTNNAYTDVTDTGSGTSIKAHAFGFIQDGQIARITRGLNQWVDTSLDGSTWSGGADGSSGTEVGDSTTRVTNLVTSPTGTFIGKEDNLYEMSAALSARKVTSFSTSDKGTDNGAGMVNFEGTDTVIYNHNRGAFLFSGVSRPARILMEAIKGMGFYPTLTHEPFKGRYMESAIAQDWLYTLVAVTESSSTFTYLLASRLDREQGRFVTYVYDRLSGVCRGLFVDSENRLWTGHVGGGTILYWQLGKDGSPDSGRDSIGFGAASETRRLYLGEVDFGWPYIRKQVFYSSFITEGSHTNITVAPAFLHDGGSEVTPMSAEVTAAGKTQLKASTLGTNDTCYRTMPVLQFKTASGYTNTGTDPLSVLKYTVQAWLRPEASDFVGGYEAILDTKVPYDGGGIPPDALTVRDELVGYQDDLAKQVMFWGTTYTMFVTDVSDLEVKKVEDEMHWVVRVQMAEFPT